MRETGEREGESGRESRWRREMEGERGERAGGCRRRRGGEGEGEREREGEGGGRWWEREGAGDGGEWEREGEGERESGRETETEEGDRGGRERETEETGRGRMREPRGTRYYTYSGNAICVKDPFTRKGLIFNLAKRTFIIAKLF